MSTTPPVGIAGIVRTDTKQTDLTVSQYDGIARPGEIVVDLTSYNVYVANLDGNLNPINQGNFQSSNISNGSSNLSIDTINGNATISINGTPNVAEFSDTKVTFKANLMPAADSLYSLGNATRQWKELWVSGSTIYIGGVPVGTTPGGNLTVNGNEVVTSTGGGGGMTVANINATGNISTSGNLSIAGDTAMAGNLTVSGPITTTSTVTAGGNISGGNLVSSGTITSTGNIDTGANLNTTGAVNASNVVASGNVTAANLVATSGIFSDTITSRTGSLSLVAVGVNQNIVLDPSGTGNIDVSSSYVVNVKDPINPTDAATKAYVDNLAQGLTPKDPVQVGAPASLEALGSGPVVYNNGIGGVGATITTTNPVTTLDGVTLTPGMRVLIPNQSNQILNGIYTYTNSTTFTRATDSDTATELLGGTFVFVIGGTTLGSSGWTIINEPSVVGVDPINWAQFSGAGSYTAGQGLVLIGSQFSMADTGVTAGTYGSSANLVSVTVNSRGQITAISNTTIGPLANLNVTGTLTAGNATVNNQLYSVGPITTLSTLTAANITTTGAVFVGQNANVVGNLVVNNNANILQTLRAVNINIPNGSITTNNFTTNSNVTVGGTATFGGPVNYSGLVSILGGVSSLRILGGTNGQMIMTNGNGNLSWSNPSAFTNLNISGNVSIGRSILSTTTLNNSTTPSYWSALDSGTLPPRWGSTAWSNKLEGINLCNFVSGSAGGIYARTNQQSDWAVVNRPIVCRAQFKILPFTTGQSYNVTFFMGSSSSQTYALGPDPTKIGTADDGMSVILQINPGNAFVLGYATFYGSSPWGQSQSTALNTLMQSSSIADGMWHQLSMVYLRDVSNTYWQLAIYLDDMLLSVNRIIFGGGGVDPATRNNSVYAGISAYGLGTSGSGRGVLVNNFFFGSGQEQYWRSYFNTGINMPT